VLTFSITAACTRCLRVRAFPANFEVLTGWLILPQIVKLLLCWGVPEWFMRRGHRVFSFNHDLRIMCGWSTEVHTYWRLRVTYCVPFFLKGHRFCWMTYNVHSNFCHLMCPCRLLMAQLSNYVVRLYCNVQNSTGYRHKVDNKAWKFSREWSSLFPGIILSYPSDVAGWITIYRRISAITTTLSLCSVFAGLQENISYLEQNRVLV